MQLKLDDVVFDPGSVVDPAGKVFHHDGRVFRAITREYASTYRMLLAAPYTRDLFNAGLIETWVSDFSIEGYELVLEHRRVPTLSSWVEWCSEMTKDAALMVLRLNQELLKHGFCTKDIQPGNVQFVDGKPYWIDFGSVAPVSSVPPPRFRFDEFRYHWLLPLWMMSKGWHGLGRQFFAEIAEGYWKSHANRKPYRWIPYWYPLMKGPARRGDWQASLDRVIARIEGLHVDPRRGEWTDYGQGGMPPVDRPDLFREKALAVYRLLQKLPPGTVLDCGGNKGWHAELAAHMGHRVTSFDTDDASVCYLYQRVKERKLPILPLVMDFLRPTPPFSVALGKPSAFDRLRSDIVLALALVHHMVFSCNVTFEPIASILSQYSRRCVIVEFPPADDQLVRGRWSRQPDWYTLDKFVDVLRPHFANIETYDSWPAPRKLLFCTKGAHLQKASDKSEDVYPQDSTV